MNILSNQIAKSIVGGGQACWGEQRAGQKNPNGDCIFDIYCVPTDKYGKPDLSYPKKHGGIEYRACNT